MIHRLRMIALAIAAGAGVSACTYGDYGYGGVSLGYGGGGYYDDYYGGGFGGNGFGSPYWGWYGDYYYPGTGYYVYDRYRRPFRWNDRQRDYWVGRRGNWRGERFDRPRWDGWDRPRGGYDGRPGYRPGFDRRPGFQNVPRGSSQSPLPGARPEGTPPGAGRGDWQLPDGAGRGGFRRPDRSPPGATRGTWQRPEGVGRGGFRRPDGVRGPRGGRPDRR